MVDFLIHLLGAAGKMGSGILLLTAVEMADLSLKYENQNKKFVLNAVDISQEALSDVLDYLRVQVRKIAEKKTIQLRKMYESNENLIENYEIIDQYINDVLRIIRPTTRLESTYDSNVVFEAISENIDLKVKILSQINNNSKSKPWFFTNTSSIPISELDDKIRLEGRILGFHFYNPPAVQRLVELIITKTSLVEIISFAKDFAKRLRKKVVLSNDIAGFIGNGHFMRDALYGISEAERLSAEMPFVEAIYTINKITHNYLVRPMGIFQLIDYVGIDVCQFIMKIMNPHLPDENLHSPLLDKIISIGVRGGQNSDGSQKNGFLQYERGKIKGIFDPDKKEYISLNDFAQDADEKLGRVPENLFPWKVVIGSSRKDEILKNYFKEIENTDTLGAKLAKKYYFRSRDIGLQLVRDEVAKSKEDLNTVLLTGFYHAYGPINDFILKEEA